MLAQGSLRRVVAAKSAWSNAKRFVSAQAVVYDRLGAPADVLKGGQVSVGESLGGSQVLVKMVSANISSVDLASVSGLIPGVSTSGICGNEGLGVVEAVGSNVKSIKKGDHVVATKAGMGTWASHAVAEESGLAAVPKEITPEQASLLGAGSAIALSVLSGLKSGDAVICNGATTAVGLAVAQIGAAKGLKVVCVVDDACADLKQASAALKAAGASVVVGQAAAGSSTFKKACKDLKPVLAVHCSASSSAATDIARVLLPCASLVAVSGAGPITLPSSLLIDRGVMVKGFHLAAALEADGAASKVVGELVELVKAGKLSPQVAASESLANFQQAIKAASASPNGSVLIKM